MAHIKDLAVGDGYVYLMEDNVKTKFYLLAHDYESSLNGTGRALFCRESPATKGPWSSANSNSRVNIGWGAKDSGETCSIYDWLTATYLNKFSADVKSWMGTTKYKAYNCDGDLGSWGTFTANTAIFTISAAESIDGTSRKDGSLLSTAALTRLKSIFTAFGANIWTRTQSTNTSNEHTSTGSGIEHEYCFDGVALNGVDRYGDFNSTYGHASEWGYLPCFTLPEDLYVRSDGFACVNTAPTVPGSISIPSSITVPSKAAGSVNVTISWAASSDTEGNLSGYTLQRSTDGGSTWAQVYQGTATSTTNAVEFGTASVMYRVRAYDSEGLTSGWRTSSKVNVISNTAPSAPSSISVPSTIKGGTTVTISWGAATDAESNLSGYTLQRSTDGGKTWTQIYQGPLLKTTNAVAFGTASVTYRVQAYDSEGQTSDWKTSSTITVDNNTAPTTPSSITVPATIYGGTSITISWSASTDAESNLSGYKLECSTDGGTTWSQIYQGAATSYNHAVVFGTATVTYRVKAYDSGSLESGWKTSSKVSVINNTAPQAPASITVPAEVKGGSSITIKWGSATDAEGNLSGYILERSVGGAAYAQVYKGTATSYTDSITKGWVSVAYRVKAYDSYNAQSAYTTSDTRTVINNTAPTVTASSTALGTKSAAFAWGYTVSDVDGDKLTVTEALDGTTTKTRSSVASGTALTFEQTNTAAGFQCVLNGDHTLQVTVSDGKLSTSKTATFTKAVYGATITLAKPLTAASAITVAALSVTGSIPADAAYKVEATNNALDDTPVWQDVTAEVKAGINFIFTNTTAAKGAAFNFRVSVSRGSSGKGGYIEAISGAFQ